MDDGGSRRWLTLAAGTVALTAGTTFQYGLAYLIPALRAQGLSLEQAGILVACPTVGLLLTLIAWGAAADRFGERLVLASGLAGAGVVLLAAAHVHGPAALGACLVAAGAAGGSVYAASGRLILGWFAASQRGLAMGIRQSAQPLGVAVAAVSLPTLATRGLAAALTFLGVFCLAAVLLVIVVVRDPAHQARGGAQRDGSPYRAPALWRIHAASALLVVPQFTVATFALVFLVTTRRWPAPAAGALLAVAATAGAASRLAAGYWSDRAGSRMRPMRALALAISAILVVLAAAAAASFIAGGARAARRRRAGGEHQRARLHRGGRVRRPGLGGPRPGHPEHRAESAGRRDAAGHGSADRRTRLCDRVRGRRRPAADRRGAGAGRGAGRRYGAAGVRPVPTGARPPPSALSRSRSSHHCWPSAGRVWIGS